MIGVDAMHRSLAAFALYALLAAAPALGSSDETAHDDVVTRAEAASRDGRHDDAISLLEAAVAGAPGSARLHHELGRALGRAADDAPWHEALGLARRTRASLERAVELSPDNPAALLDLMKFYHAAPGFLGGDTAKADAIVERLEQIAPDTALTARRWREERS